MKLCIISMAIIFTCWLIAIISISIKDNNNVNSDEDLVATHSMFILFIVVLALTLGLRMNTASNKALYTDMANNPQCYSINDLKDARKAIIRHKARQGHWTSFYNGYEFPEINVDTMGSVDQTMQIVK